MSNKFIDPSVIARMASIELDNRLITGNLISRDVEAQFANKVGDSVKVVVTPEVEEAQEFTGTTSATAVVEREQDVVLQKHFYSKVALTTKEMTLSLEDFAGTILAPRMTGLGASIDKYFIAKMAGGFRRNVAGTMANRPSTIAHYLAASKVLDDKWVPEQGRIMLHDTTVHNTFLQLKEFNDLTLGAQNVLQNLQINDRAGATWVKDAHLDLFNAGDIDGTVTASGTAGASTIALAALTAATGTILEGTSFTIAGNATRFVVTADTAIAANAVAALPIYPALPAGFSPSTAVVTFLASYQNMLYVPSSVVGAIVAPAPLLGAQSATYSVNGLSVRASYDSSISTLGSSLVLDVFVGARVIQPNGGVIVAG